MTDGTGEFAVRRHPNANTSTSAKDAEGHIGLMSTKSLRRGVLEPRAKHPHRTPGLFRYAPPWGFPATPYHRVLTKLNDLLGYQTRTLQNPLCSVGGAKKMIQISPMSRQPVREAWTMQQLNSKLAINLGLAIDRATHDTYSSALNSYLTFCRLHNIDIEPTQRTLALFVTFQSAHINPKSVDSYLSGIAN